MNLSSHTDQSSLNALPYSEHRIPRGNFTIYARHYAGKGPAFVFMHGFPDNLHIYDRLIPLLNSCSLYQKLRERNSQRFFGSLLTQYRTVLYTSQ